MTPYEVAVSRYRQKNVLIFGLGLLGGAIGDARFFAGLGAKVRATDKKTSVELASSLKQLSHLPIEYSFGGTSEADIEWADIIIRNPGIPESHPLLSMAVDLHKQVEMRSALFAELSGIPIVGITGTRGKTTTTWMIYQILHNVYKKQVLLAGNIQGMSDLELLPKISDPNQYIAVMELSSWQLQGFEAKRISPHIAVITNLYPDHQNVYPNLTSYYQDKFAIIAHQNPSDVAILNSDQLEFKAWSQRIKSRVEWFKADDISDSYQLLVPGHHNRLNAAAAYKVGISLGLPPDEILSSLTKFKGVPFRLQTIRHLAGVTYINDTTATTPIATQTALKAITASPVLICGGADKNLEVTELAKAINQSAKYIVLLQGTGTERLKPLLNQQKIVAEVNSMSAAVNQAFSISKPGDTVLLSPGFASFGLFTNEFDRGEQFNQCVQQLPTTGI